MTPPPPPPPPAPAPNQPALLTPTTLATLGGLATAVLVIVNSVHSATGWTSAWFGLVLSLALALVVEFALSQSNSDRPRFARAILALINGCLVFTTALGGNQIGNRVAGPGQPDVAAAQPHVSILPSSYPEPPQDRRFFHDWL